jgi:hypothetical protein
VSNTPLTKPRRSARAEPVAGVGEFAHHGLGQLARHAVERADVGHHAQVDLLDHEEGIGAAVAQAAGRHEVHGATHAAALDSGDHREAGFGQGVEGGLQPPQLLAETLARKHRSGVQCLSAFEHRQVHPGREVPSGG